MWKTCQESASIKLLRQLQTVRPALTTEAAKTLVHSFILCRVDYCNSVLSGVSAVHRHPLQSVLNSAARLVTRKRKYDHISAAMYDELHWLPAEHRIQYKVCTLVYKCLHSAAPRYLTEMFTHVTEVAGRRHLRSAAHGDLAIPRTRTIRYGPRAFTVAGPQNWNSLSLDTRVFSLYLRQFCSRLKTELFRSIDRS